MPIFVSTMQRQNINPIFSFGFMGILVIILMKFLPENKGGIDDYIPEHRKPLLSVSGEHRGQEIESRAL